MFITFPKHKGFSAGNVRDCVGSGNRALKEVGKNASNDSGEGNDQRSTERSSPRGGSTSNTSDLSRTRPRRKRRRRRRRVKKSQEEIQSHTGVLKFQVRRKRGRRRRKRKRKVHAKDNVMCLESSGSVSIPPMSSNGSHSSNDFSHVSPMEYENLPWANLEVPMDLSHVNIEVKDHGVDFDLQARENHLRWLANLEKANEKSTCLEKISQ